LLSQLLVQHEVDIWFSTEGTWWSDSGGRLLDGDLVSARDGALVAPQNELFVLGVPAGIPSRGVDFGLDAVTGSREGDVRDLQFSSELMILGDEVLADSDVLGYRRGVVLRSSELMNCHDPASVSLGLDAVYRRIQTGAFEEFLIRIK
jgi:hypothetical protein